METVIAGSGNVAEAIACAIMEHNLVSGGIELTQIFARGDRGAELAAKLSVPFTYSPAGVAEADLYILAVSDSAINEVSESINIPCGAVVAHTAGGVGIGEISSRHKNRAVLYPFQTFTKGRRVDFRDIPVFIEYTTPQAEEAIRTFARELSARVTEADSDVRARIHLAGVFACNFPNHLYALAARIAAGAGVPFESLKPLITETAAKALSVSDPSAVQTGPAVRGDKITMERHLSLLSEETKSNYEEIYKLLSVSIWQTSKR